MANIPIDANLLLRLRREAEASAHEICGLLFGADRIERAEPAANVSAEPVHAFEIDPVALFAAIRAERAGGARLIGHYHSHPGGSAEPSPRDLAAAEPGKLWLILGAGEARLWLAGEGAFSEVKMIVNQDCA